MKTKKEIAAKKHLLTVLRDRSLMAIARRLHRYDDLSEKVFKNDIKYADLSPENLAYLQRMHWSLELGPAIDQVLAEPAERKRMMSLEDSEISTIYSAVNTSGAGYAVGADDDSPEVAALGASYTVLRTTIDGIVVCLDAEGHGALVADAHGPWAVSISDYAEV